MTDIMKEITQPFTKRLVYGEPIDNGSVTVIPAAAIWGGAGAGPDDVGGSPGEPSGGFGLMARPVGAFVIKGERVRWKPTVDVSRIVIGGQLLGLAYFVVTWLVERQRRHIETG